jgi:hypothetical protein
MDVILGDATANEGPVAHRHSILINQLLKRIKQAVLRLEMR